MNKHEAIKKVEQMGEYERFVNELIPKLSVLNILNQLYEPEKVKIPQFVAQHIEWTKGEDFHLLGAMSRENFDKKLEDWFYTDDNMELFARAWLDGYEVEKEKRYEVVLHNGQSLKTVYRQGVDHLDFEMVYGDLESFTRKRLEYAGFGWVFDCEGIEIEEVE